MRLSNCIEKYCNTRASFNYKGEVAGLYCVRHKKADMINVLYKRCIEAKCRKKGKFYTINKETGELDEREAYCQAHKKEGMITALDKKQTQEVDKVETIKDVNMSNISCNKVITKNIFSQYYYINHYHNWLHMIFTQ
jgi:hypothetical protein